VVGSRGWALAAMAVGVSLTLLSSTAPARARSTPTCFGQPATSVGTPGDDTLTGTPGADVIVGLGGDDVIKGLAGDDLLCGGAGADTLIGGLGDDQLSGGADKLVLGIVGDDPGVRTLFGDTLEPGPGDDVLSPGYERGYHGSLVWRGDVISFAGSSHGVQVDLTSGTVTGQGHDRLVHPHRFERIEVIGSPQADVIQGSPWPDWVDAGAGNDVVNTRDGKDNMVESPGSGNDVYDGGRGSDQIQALDGRDILRGAQDRDVFRVFDASGGATVEGGGGNDGIYVFAGPSDTLVGPRFSYDLGTGDNTLSIDDWKPISRALSVDLAQGLLQRGQRDSSISGVHQLSIEVQGSPVTVVGNDESNWVGVETASTVTARLGAGNDTLFVDHPTDSVNLRTGSGNDELDLLGLVAPVTARMGNGNDDVYTWAFDTGTVVPKNVYGGPGDDSICAEGTGYIWYDFEEDTCIN
jgi:Ca2+-binding RTX toxin-like protein